MKVLSRVALGCALLVACQDAYALTDQEFAEYTTVIVLMHARMQGGSTDFATRCGQNKDFLNKVICQSPADLSAFQVTPTGTQINLASKTLRQKDMPGLATALLERLEASGELKKNSHSIRTRKSLDIGQIEAVAPFEEAIASQDFEAAKFSLAIIASQDLDLASDLVANLDPALRQQFELILKKRIQEDNFLSGAFFDQPAAKWQRHEPE